MGSKTKVAEGLSATGEAASLRDTPTKARLAELAARLHARRGEMEEAVVARTNGAPERRSAMDPAYAEGVRAAIPAALSYCIDAIALEEERPAAPATVLAHARLAARGDVPLEAILRRYFAGYTLFGDFVIEEAEAVEPIEQAALRRLLQGLAVRFDRLVTLVADEYRREIDARHETTDQRRARAVRRLLGGELVDFEDFGYDLDGFHVGAIASGPGAAEAVRELSTALSCRLLLIRQGEGTVWAWLGSRRRADFAGLGLQDRWPERLSLALGEPGEGVAGWRLTHQQATAVLPIAMRGPETVIRYADAALLASSLRDDVLRTSLNKLYLDPLAGERDGGEVARRTLRAYLATGRNVTSTAASLGVNRNTVSNRLRSIEVRIGRSLDSCAVELETALRLDELSERDSRAKG